MLFQVARGLPGLQDEVAELGVESSQAVQHLGDGLHRLPQCQSTVEADGAPALPLPRARALQVAGDAVGTPDHSVAGVPAGAAAGELGVLSAASQERVL